SPSCDELHAPPSFPTRRSSDLAAGQVLLAEEGQQFPPGPEARRGDLRDLLVAEGLTVVLDPDGPAADLVLVDLVGDRLQPLRPLDRKSTRLNSSHVKISYAVCC